mmetsp:Transcript_46756/g.102095  ORF Transcript_46756/g.102095 Transcript_46756/m.102095 type:complete len:832 (+) Transcript_46756:48-2543(+)
MPFGKSLAPLPGHASGGLSPTAGRGQSADAVSPKLGSLEAGEDPLRSPLGSSSGGGSSGVWGGGGKGSKDLRVAMLGLPLHRLAPSEKGQLAVLAAMVLVASVVFAALQERVLYIPGFKYTGWMALLTSATYVVCAYLERLGTGERMRLGSMVEYGKLSVMTMGGMYFTNWSLRYLSYPLRVVFKSSKLVPVMLLSVIYLKKRYTAAQYVSAGLLTLGVVIFTLGDAKGRASFDPRGLGIIVTGSFMEAMAANFEEKRLFNQLGCPATEVLLYSSLIGCAWALIADAVTGDLLPAVRHSRDHPETVLITFVASLAGYVSMNGVLVLIKHYGATLAEILKSCRKILTISISFVLYGKPLTWCHIAGCLLFASSMAVERFAAGGSSRRFAGVLFGSSLCVATYLLTAAPAQEIFSIVIDAGSSGTRLNIFRFDAWTSRLLDIGGAGQVHVSQEPGLSAFAWNQSAIPSKLRPLLDAALRVVPMAQRSATPLALRATAGLRLLPKKKADEVLAEVQKLLAPYGFKNEGVEVMAGEEEGECEWLTVNFLMGAFRPGIQAVSDPAAVVDLGGGSVQMAYYVNDGDAESGFRKKRGDYFRKLALPFGSGHAHIYQHSYLGYGLMAARGKSLTDPGAAASQDRHPCLPNDAVVTLRQDGKDLEARGATDMSRCAQLAAAILHGELPCGKTAPSSPRGDSKSGNADGCTFAGSWGGPGVGSQRLVLASYFFDRMLDAGVIAQGKEQAVLHTADFVSEASSVCSTSRRGVEALATALPWLPRERAEWLCFDLSYQAALLSTGFGLAKDRELIVVKQIAYEGRHFEASWALGIAIKHFHKK